MVIFKVFLLLLALHAVLSAKNDTTTQPKKLSHDAASEKNDTQAVNKIMQNTLPKTNNGSKSPTPGSIPTTNSVKWPKRSPQLKPISIKKEKTGTANITQMKKLSQLSRTRDSIEHTKKRLRNKYPKKMTQNSPSGHKRLNCKKIKCPSVERPVCAKLIYNNNMQNKTMYVIMINKCEIKYAKCHKGLDATIVPMENCGHTKLKNKINVTANTGKRRQKREIQLDSPTRTTPKSQVKQENKNTEAPQSKHLNTRRNLKPQKIELKKANLKSVNKSNLKNNNNTNFNKTNLKSLKKPILKTPKQTNLKTFKKSNLESLLQTSLKTLKRTNTQPLNKTNQQTTLKGLRALKKMNLKTNDTSKKINIRTPNLDTKKLKEPKERQGEAVTEDQTVTESEHHDSKPGVEDEPKMKATFESTEDADVNNVNPTIPQEADKPEGAQEGKIELNEEESDLGNSNENGGLAEHTAQGDNEPKIKVIVDLDDADLGIDPVDAPVQDDANSVTEMVGDAQYTISQDDAHSVTEMVEDAQYTISQDGNTEKIMVGDAQYAVPPNDDLESKSNSPVKDDEYIEIGIEIDTDTENLIFSELGNIDNQHYDANSYKGGQGGGEHSDPLQGNGNGNIEGEINIDSEDEKAIFEGEHSDPPQGNGDGNIEGEINIDSADEKAIFEGEHSDPSQGNGNGNIEGEINIDSADEKAIFEGEHSDPSQGNGNGNIEGEINIDSADEKAIFEGEHSDPSQGNGNGNIEGEINIDSADEKAIFEGEHSDPPQGDGNGNIEGEINIDSEDEKAIFGDESHPASEADGDGSGKDDGGKDDGGNDSGNNDAGPQTGGGGNVNQEEYQAKCPRVCPARDMMVCAMCHHEIYKTFQSVCHMRMFQCHHPGETLELVSRYPCVMSAPYLSRTPPMQPEGHLSEPHDRDQVIRFIRCREKGRLNQGTKCTFDDTVNLNEEIIVTNNPTEDADY